MSNALIAFGNVADAATLSGGSWLAGLPLANLQDQNVKKVARSSNLLAASTTLIAALAASTHIDALSLEGTNATPLAQARWRTYTDAGLTALVYDSGTIDVYPVNTLEQGSVPWGAPNWWTGRPLQADVDKFQNSIRHIPSIQDYAQYIKCEVFDTTNPAGYFQAGRLFVGNAFVPKRAMEFGAAIALTSRSLITRARDGTRYFQGFRPDISMPIAFPFLSQAEAMQALALQATVDTQGEVMFFWDPADIQSRFRRSLFGRLAPLSPIAYPRYANYSTAFQIEGTL